MIKLFLSSTQKRKDTWGPIQVLRKKIKMYSVLGEHRGELKETRCARTLKNNDIW
jgi:hypothetical protein